jgi:hypothetical protein
MASQARPVTTSRPVLRRVTARAPLTTTTASATKVVSSQAAAGRRASSTAATVTSPTPQSRAPTAG